MTSLRAKLNKFNFYLVLEALEPISLPYHMTPTKKENSVVTTLTLYDKSLMGTVNSLFLLSRMCIDLD